MSNLILNPVATWHDNINQVEITEPILGGDGGNANLAARQLAENLLWLRNKIETAKPIQVGDIYTTTINHANPAAVATHHGYGTWVRYAEGRTLVGYSSQLADPASYKTIGNEFGVNEHTLTVAEMPVHNHSSLTIKYNVDANLGGVDKTVEGTGASGNAGGGQPHNNIQPSKVVGCWLRTA